MISTCPDLSVPIHIMQHVVNIESSGNPYAIGVVKGKLSRQPRNLAEALAAVKMLEKKGYNFSVGIAQINRYNLKRYGLHSYEQAFQVCPNLQVGTKILKECYDRAKSWGKAFSCYYSGNFVTGYRHGYVQKITASIQREQLLKTKGINNKSKNDSAIIVIANDTKNATSTNNTIMGKKVLQKSSEQINYSALLNRNHMEQHLVQQTTPIKSTAVTATMVSPSIMPNVPETAVPQIPQELPNITRKVGIAEITPKVYTDNAFVF